MKPISRSDLRNQLKKREIAPVYTLYGPETYLRDLAAATIADIVFGKEGFRDFNESEFSLNAEGGLLAALAAAEQLPMMAERRVVRVVDVRVAATAAKDTLKEADEAALRAYLERPAESAVVIFIADEINGVRRLGKLMTEKTVAVLFEKLGDNDLVDWARRRFLDLGTEADEGALRQLAALTGPDLRRLANEVDKLSAAALPEKKIGVELVEQLVPNVRELDNFSLTDQMLAGNTLTSLRTLKKILDDGAEPIMLLGLLSYNFRRLLMAKDMMEHGAERADVARVVNLRYSNQEPFLAAARRTDKRKLMAMIERLAAADLAMKSSIGGGGPAGQRLQLETLICELMLD